MQPKGRLLPRRVHRVKIERLRKRKRSCIAECQLHTTRTYRWSPRALAHTEAMVHAHTHAHVVHIVRARWWRRLVATAAHRRSEDHDCSSTEACVRNAYGGANAAKGCSPRRCAVERTELRAEYDGVGPITDSLRPPCAECLVEELRCLPVVEIEHRHAGMPCGYPCLGFSERILPSAPDAEHRGCAARPRLVDRLAARPVALAPPTMRPAVIIKRGEPHRRDRVTEQPALRDEHGGEGARLLDEYSRPRGQRLAKVATAAFRVPPPGALSHLTRALA